MYIFEILTFIFLNFSEEVISKNEEEQKHKTKTRLSLSFSQNTKSWIRTCI